MLVWLWTRTEGVTDTEFKDGDIFQIKNDDFEESIGEQEKKSWLIVKMPDHPLREELISSEYAPSAGEDPVIRRLRKYRVDWRTKFSPEEIEIIEDATQFLGSGIVADKFDHEDITRK